MQVISFKKINLLKIIYCIFIILLSTQACIETEKTDVGLVEDEDIEESVIEKDAEAELENEITQAETEESKDSSSVEEEKTTRMTSEITTTGDLFKVTFRYIPAEGESPKFVYFVWMAGYFDTMNENLEMKKQADGTFTKTMYLKEGIHEYFYHVDGIEEFKMNKITNKIEPKPTKFMFHPEATQDITWAYLALFFAKELVDAAKANNTSLAKQLVNSGYTLNDYYPHIGYTALHYAVINNNTELVRALLQAGVNSDLRIQVIEYKTPLMLAVDNYEMIKVLVNGGANLNSVDRFSNTILTLLCQKNKTEDEYYKTVRFLLDNGADVNHASNRYGSSLFISVKNNNVRLEELLLEYGAKKFTSYDEMKERNKRKETNK